MILRIFGYLFGIGAVFFLLIAGALAWYVSGLAQDLPDYEVLAKYEPPVMTRIHASDGQLIAEYAHERRLYLPIQAIPDRVKAAFLSAEDKNFYHHSGLDYYGIARAMIQNIRSYGSGARPIGASTITQQVAKNFLLTNEQSIVRKVKEAILSLRIEQAYSKDKILELYLNEIFLGLGAYGVAAASLEYFDKSVHELTLPEAAYLAALPKAPNNYNPFRYPDRAIERRNWVIDRMVENGFATPEEGEAAKQAPIGVKTRRAHAAPVRCRLLRRGGAPPARADVRRDGALRGRPVGPHHARPQAPGDGAEGADGRAGEVRPPARLARAVKHFDSLGEDWGVTVAAVPALTDVIEWQLAIVLGSGGDGIEIGLQPGHEPGTGKVRPERVTGVIPSEGMKWVKKGALKVGDVIYVSKREGDGQFDIEQVPEIEGALVAMDPHTGRVLAMVGGFSFSESQFNRATQAMRQPGSSFKPFVYSAALDNGYTPSSVVMDAPIEVDPGFGQPIWRPEQLLERVLRSVDAAHRHREIAERDDGPARPGHGHAAGLRVCAAVRRLRQPAAVPADGARRRRDHGAADGVGLFGVRQWRPLDQPDPDRSHPEPLRRDDLPP